MSLDLNGSLSVADQGQQLGSSFIRLEARESHLRGLPAGVCVNINTKQTNAAKDKSSTEENDCLSA